MPHLATTLQVLVQVRQAHARRPHAPWRFFPRPDAGRVTFSAPRGGCGRARTGHGAMAMALRCANHASSHDTLFQFSFRDTDTVVAPITKLYHSRFSKYINHQSSIDQKLWVVSLDFNKWRRPEGNFPGRSPVSAPSGSSEQRRQHQAFGVLE